MKRYSLDNVTSVLSIPMENILIKQKLQREKSDLMYNSISGWSLKMALWCFTTIPSQEIRTYIREKSHHSFPQDIIHVRLGNMNPYHPLCFFSYFLHEESIALWQHKTSYQNIYSPTSPTSMHAQCNKQLIRTLTQTLTSLPHFAFCFQLILTVSPVILVQTHL